MLGLAGGASGATAPPERIVFSSAGDVFLVGPDGRSGRRLTQSSAPESEPELSPDGTRVAFVRGGRLFVRRLDEAEARPVTSPPRGVDVSPSWSPRGDELVFVRGSTSGSSELRIVGADGSNDRSLRATGQELQPDWSPDGRRIAFVDEPGGNGEIDVYVLELADGAVTRLTDDPGTDGDPAWSPDGRRIAFVSHRGGDPDVYVMAADGSGQLPLVAGPGHDRSPSWSPDGSRLAFSRDDAISVAGADGSAARRIAGGTDPAWGRAIPPPPPPPAPAPRPRPKPKPRVAERLPDFDQRAPSGLTVTQSRGRYLLGFTSATDNVGVTAVRIRGFRPHRLVPTMRADQVVPLANGRTRVVRGVGVLRYTWSPDHSHWHLLRFQAYELRRASDFRLLVRDRKSGFCLADHYGLARHRVRGFGPPRFLGSCGAGRPDLLAVEQGTSIGYTDRYPAHFHGQNVDVTGLPSGAYVLVHRANPTGRLRERTAANNAASVRLRLTWPHGRRALPSVRVLRVCEARERC